MNGHMNSFNDCIWMYFILEFHGLDTEVLLSDPRGHWKLPESQNSSNSMAIKALNFYIQKVTRYV